MSKKETLHIYCRVSTRNQGDDGSSLEVQEKRGLKVSKLLNLKPKVIKEVGSGMKPYLETREEFTNLMEGIEDGKIKNVWIDEETEKIFTYRIGQVDFFEAIICIVYWFTIFQRSVISGVVENRSWAWLGTVIDVCIDRFAGGCEW